METHHGVRAACSHLAVCLLISTLALPRVALAGPLVIEEVARITNPEPTYTGFGTKVAVDGDSVIVEGSRLSPSQSEIDQAAFLFQRNSAGAWVFVRKLVEVTQPVVGGYFPMVVAMNGGVAAVSVGALYVFERTASGWIPATVDQQLGNAAVDMEVAAGMILVSSVGGNPSTGTCAEVGNLYQKQASGAWAQVHQFLGFDRGDFCDDESRGPPLSLSSNRAILLSGGARIYERNADGSWPRTATAIVNVDSSAGTAIEGSDAIVAANPNLAPVVGPYALARSNGTWGVATNLNRPDRVVAEQRPGIDLLNGIAAAAYKGSASIFQHTPAGLFDYVAKLVASDTSATRGVDNDVAMSGRRVVTGGSSAAYVFELPTDFSQPALGQDDFEDRNALGWTPLAGSAFSVVSSGGSFVYRQTSVAGAAGAVRTGMDWTNQAIEADVVPRSFAPGGAQGWFGLLVRQTDPGNYYYLTMRSTNTVSLRKLENGVIKVLANASLPVVLNRPYKLRLEAVGTQVRGYVDGQLRVQARDTTHRHGAAGLRMFNAAADHDNVVISPNPRLVIYSDDFAFSRLERWFTRLGTWVWLPDSQAFAQTSLGNGRVTTNVSADDQVIQVRARATAYSSASGDKWFGIVARLQDDQSFYYVTLRNDNTVSLRKLVNGQIFVLDSAPLSVSLNTGYTLRLEAIGLSPPSASIRDSALRVYVNGRMFLEAHDTNFPEGTYGLATSKAAARFDDFVVSQP